MSSSLILPSLTPNFWSAFAFIFIFCSASLSFMFFCFSRTGGVTSRRVVLSYLWLSASHGEMLVVERGVARYCRKNLQSSCFHFLCSTVTTLTHFPCVFMKYSASWRKPRCSAKFLSSMPLKDGPLSLFRTTEIPCLAKNCIEIRDDGSSRSGCDNFNFWETVVFVYDDHEVLSRREGS